MAEIFKKLEEATLSFQEHLPVALSKIEIELEGYKFIIPSGTKREIKVLAPNAECALNFSDLSIVHRLILLSPNLHSKICQEIEETNLKTTAAIHAVCDHFLKYVDALNTELFK